MIHAPDLPPPWSIWLRFPRGLQMYGVWMRRYRSAEQQGRRVS